MDGRRHPRPCPLALVRAGGSGALGDRYGRVRVVAIALVGYGAGFLVPFVTTSRPAIVAAIPFIALGGGTVMTMAYALLMPLMPEAEHGALTGVYSVSRGIGITTGPVPAGVLIWLTGGSLSPGRGAFRRCGSSARRRASPASSSCGGSPARCTAELTARAMARAPERAPRPSRVAGPAPLRPERPAERCLAWWERIAGGPVRATVIGLLAIVLGLDNADLGTVGAMGSELERALSLSNGDLGLLAAVPSLCAAVLTLPLGVLADRMTRVRLLWMTMLVWSAAQAVSGLAGSFEQLLLIRVVLGAATGAAMPIVASLVGDLFPAVERGRIWGMILSGELLGSAFGYVIAGEAASLGGAGTGWRIAFFVLAAPSLAAAWLVRRRLPEPARGGAARLEPGAREFVSVPRAPSQSPPQIGLRGSVTAVLSVRTNVVLIIASALGYFYFTGVLTFGLTYFQGRYALAHGAATLLLALLGLGGLVGVVAGGRLADRLARRGLVNGRILVGGSALVLTALLFGPALLPSSDALALPLLILAAAALGARNPPLDAARLDIMHHTLWGRAEAVRTFLRRLVTASAPLLFGLLADGLGAPGAAAAANAGGGTGASANAHGLQLAFLVLLLVPLLGGALTFLATRSYPGDVAAAQAAERASSGSARPQPQGRRQPPPPKPV